jgi:alkylated DNA repair protein (DNA oxidative demethylase)
MELDGFRLHPAALTAGQQTALVADVMSATEAAPLCRAVTPGGKPMSVLTTSFGPLGWVSDRAGYRYQETHPETGRPWPAMPAQLLDLWRRFCPGAPPPDSCLVNLYRDGARMGLHQDRDEQDFDVPVLSLSLGDTALFRLGGLKRNDPTRSFRLTSGDVCVIGGASRLVFHGIDRVIPGSSRLVPGGGRINLTMRRAR